MKGSNIRSRSLALVLALAFLFTSGVVLAQGIKERMQERLPEINLLKTQEVVGEASTGYLELRGDAGDKAALVEAENADRQAVYEAIAKQQRTTALLVGQRRALQIAEIAVPGTWLQDAQGKWYKK